MFTQAFQRSTRGDAAVVTNPLDLTATPLPPAPRRSPRRDLAQQVEDLGEQLRQSRNSRQREIAEKERVATRLSNLLHALPGAVVVLDGNGRIEQFNPAAEDLLEGLAIGASWSAIVSDNIAPQWDDGHDLTLRNGRRVNISTQALSSEPGQILLLTDVTETRRLQEGLNLYKRLSASTEVAAALAHQLRTPLAAALLDSAQLACGSDDRTRAGATRVRDALRRLERLIEDVLLFARGGELGAAPTTNGELLGALSEAIAEMRLPASFAVSVSPAADQAGLLLNQNAILSAMLNLVHNAVQACAGVGTLRVDCRRDGAMLCFSFADSGPGVNPAAAERIFEPFVTLRVGGTGMGLPVARSVARAHGGELALVRRAGSGALFELRLPVVEPDPQLAGAGARA